MKNNCNLLLQSFLILSLWSCLIACHKRNPKPVFQVDDPGSEVIASYGDSIPQLVFFYKVDKSGNKTQEKIGEAYYYDNKQEYVGGGLKEGKREGKWYAFFKDGSVQTEAFYINGKEHGNYNVYRENGKPLFKGHYDHGICNGTWYWYNEKGDLLRKIQADENTIACEYCEKCLKLKL